MSFVAPVKRFRFGEFTDTGLRDCANVITQLSPNIKSYTQHIFHCLQIIEDPKATDRSKCVATFDLLSSWRYLSDLFNSYVCDADTLMICWHKIDEQVRQCCQEKKRKSASKKSNTEEVEGAEEENTQEDAGEQDN